MSETQQQFVLGYGWRIQFYRHHGASFYQLTSNDNRPTSFYLEDGGEVCLSPETRPNWIPFPSKSLSVEGLLELLKLPDGFVWERKAKRGDITRCSVVKVKPAPP